MKTRRTLDNKIIQLMREQEIILEPTYSRRNPDYSKFNILLVDDNSEIIKSLSNYLTAVEDFSVIATESPYIAKELIKSYEDNEINATVEMLIERSNAVMEKEKENKKLAEKDYVSYLKAGLQLPEAKDLAKIYDEGIVVIVSDAKMGGINGFQLLNFASFQIPDTFRLIISAEIGYAQERSPEELFASGAIGYINKGMQNYENALVDKIKHVFGEEVLAKNIATLTENYRGHIHKI